MTSLSPDTQATLLLVGRFAKPAEVKPLTTAEYNGVAKQLHELGMRPADIMREIPTGLGIDADRLTKLLTRGTALALAMERWLRLGIQVIGRSDAAYPALLRKKLRGSSAPILYCAGATTLMESEGVCVVGSRNASESGMDFASQLGRRCAAEALTIVSGDARGIDRSSMDGALDANGNVIAVLVDSLSKAVLAKRNREPIRTGRLLLITPYDPDEGFTVAKAMDRNKYMYALSSAAVIVDSDIKGGTWTGAVENEKHRWAQAFVRIAPDAAPGNRRLSELGLRPIEDVHAGPMLRDILFSKREIDSPQFDLAPSEDPRPDTLPKAETSLYALFLDRLTEWLTAGAQTEDAIAARFELELPQAAAWLKRASDAGALQRLDDPVRFTV